jgi:hypothetical protein
MDFIGPDHFGIREIMDIPMLAVGLEGRELNFVIVILILPLQPATSCFNNYSAILDIGSQNLNLEAVKYKQ